MVKTEILETLPEPVHSIPFVLTGDYEFVESTLHREESGVAPVPMEDCILELVIQLLGDMAVILEQPRTLAL